MCHMAQMVMIMASLEPGDEIIINAGFGSPETEKQAIDIIANVNGFSALTAQGIKIICKDARGIIKTGKHFDVFEISPKAKKILKNLGLS